MILRSVRMAAWILAGLALVALAGWFGMVALLGHRFYSVTGTARIKRTSIHQTSLPAIVCVGHGGPLERSGVYARPLSVDDQESHARVLCRQPARDIEFRYGTAIYTNAKPRAAHAYVWLEPHEELADVCAVAVASGDFVGVPLEALAGYKSDSPTRRPCHRPAPSAVLGYAVAFERWFSEDEQHADVELLPSGYPGSRTTAR